MHAQNGCRTKTWDRAQVFHKSLQLSGVYQLSALLDAVKRTLQDPKTCCITCSLQLFTLSGCVGHSRSVQVTSMLEIKAEKVCFWSSMLRNLQGECNFPMTHQWVTTHMNQDFKKCYHSEHVTIAGARAAISCIQAIIVFITLTRGHQFVSVFQLCLCKWPLRLQFWRLLFRLVLHLNFEVW